MNAREPGHSPSAPDAVTGDVPGGGSLLAELAGAEDPGAQVGVVPPARRISSHVVVMGVLLLISVAALYGMRRIGMKAGFSFAEVNIEYPVEESRKNALADHERILSELDRIGSPPQVPPDRIEKNPFVFLIRRLLGEETAGVEQRPDRASELEKQRREARRRELQTLAASLTLTSTIDGGGSRHAVIGGRVYGVGDTIDDTFVVTAIGDRWAEVSADGHSFVIEQAMTSAPDTRRRRLR